MGVSFKKLFFLGLLSYLVYLTVDFSQPEFATIRHHVDSQLDHLKSHKYYNDYVIPAKSKIEPIVFKVNDEYVTPSYKKVNAAVLDKYQVYLSTHVSNTLDKIVKSPLYQKIHTQQPLVSKYYHLVQDKAKYINTLAVRYIIIGFNKAAQGSVLLKNKLHLHYKVAHPLAVDFYHKKAVPHGKLAYAKSLEFLSKARLYAIDLYQAHISPFVKPKYDQYLKTHIDNALTAILKYYNLLKLEKIVSLSHKYYSSAYEQIIKYGESKSGEQQEDSEPTLATADSPTSFEQNTDTPSVDITPENTNTQEEIETEFEELSETVQETASISSDETTTSTDKSLETKNEESEESELTLSLADEITSWRSFIDATVDNIFKNFDKSITELEQEKVDEARPLVTELLQNLSQTSNRDYAYINRIIYDINSTTVILENGEEAELDLAGNIIDHKISRQEIRDLLSEKSGYLKILADKVNTELQKAASQIEELLEIERKLIIDIFEEFAEVAINEFSKKMMYSSFSNTFKKIDQAGLEDDDENFSDWKEYVKAKNFLIKRREELIAKKPDFAIINKLTREVAFTLKTLEQDSGNGFAILRAKANLAFQAREARERALEAAIEEGRERTETHLIRRTATIGDDGQITFPSEETPLSSQTSSQKVIVDEPIRSYVQLSKDNEDVKTVNEPKVGEPVKSFAQVSKETEEPESEYEFSKGEDPTVYGSIVEEEIHAFETPDGEPTAGSDAIETETSTNEEDEEDYEEEEEEEEDDEDIIEHQPDSEESEPEEDIVEHQPDSVDDAETAVPEDTPEVGH